MVSNAEGRENFTTDPYHIMTKPVGAICNMDCAYCFYLEKEGLYPETSDFRMRDDVLHRYIEQYIAQPGDQVTFTWQGGEPTLLGVEFFRKAVELQRRFNSQGKEIRNTLQTNGILLDEEWAEFFWEHNFLIGLSIDGPDHVHNKYRPFKGGQESFDAVKRGMEILSEHGVEYNLLGCVNEYSSRFPIAIYDFYLENSGTKYWQFIPIVERDLSTPSGVSSESVAPDMYGDFLITLFNRWVRNDIGRVSIQIIDTAFRVYLGMKAGLCIFEETCGNALAIEHNGDLYSCDHFVEPGHRLGNVMETSLSEMVGSPQQRQFGRVKSGTLPEYCQQCKVRFLCNGGCPKNRFSETPDGEDGLNYLCAGYKKFFQYIDPYMRYLARAYQSGRTTAEMMGYIRGHPEEFVGDIGRNDLCYCASGRKYKKCCGR